MNTIAIMTKTALGELFREGWVLTSLQAGALVWIVLGIQMVFQKQLRPKWRYALWWVVVLKLVLPWSLESSWSLFNWVKPPLAMTQSPDYPPDGQAKRTSPPSSPSAQNDPGLNPIAMEGTVVGIPSTQISEVGAVAQERGEIGISPATELKRTWDFLTVIRAVWVLVATLLAMGVVVRWIRFHRLLKKTSVPANAAILELFEQCKAEVGLKQKVVVWETSLTESPALFGLFRPRLLLPKGMRQRFADDELRYIFLHELAHLRRGDLWQNCLLTVLQIAHWFNPLIWYGFMRMRADRELACDEMALVHSGAKTGQGYGHTVVKLLEQLHARSAVPGGVGILEDRNQMKRRLKMIVRYRPSRHWSVFAIILFLCLAWVSLTGAQNSSGKLAAPNVSRKAETSQEQLGETGAVKTVILKGVVETRDGDELTEGAMVFIATASPKVGTSTFCPSCYADCRKRAKSAKDGSFVMEGLNAELKFQVLAVAKGYKPKILNDVDPAKGPVHFALDPIESSDLKPDQTLRGRVLDPKGQPVEGAMVEMEGIQTRDGGGSWGQLNGIDPRAVTDDKGEFLITSKKRFEMMAVNVVARGFAPKKFVGLQSGGVRHDLTVREGVTLKGRVISKEGGVEGVSVGVSGVERSVEVYLGHFEVGTGKDGVFEFVNLPPEGDYYVYGLMKSMGARGALPLHRIMLGKDGSTTDMGTLEMRPAFKVSGKLEFADGSSTPPKTRILLSRDDAWDSMQVTADEEGRFEFPGVPGEVVTLSVRRRGWKLSEANYSLDPLNPYQLMGRADGSNTNLLVKLEMGEPSRNPRMPVRFDYAAEKNKPLHGSEVEREEVKGWKWSGRVVDADTMKPLARYQVGAGNLEPWGRYEWEAKKKVSNEEGQFSLNVRKEMANPALQISAEGYLPISERLNPKDHEGLEFKLQKGIGPKGKVVEADGSPAAFVKVAQLGGGHNWVALDPTGKLTSYHNDECIEETEDDGTFEFKPQLEVTHVMVLARAGFALVSTESLKKESIIRLEPFGRIEGLLKKDGEVLTNMDLDLGFADSRKVQLNNLGHAVTDSKGRFQFANVPPGKILVRLRQYEAGTRSRWSLAELGEVEVQSGRTTTVDFKAPAQLQIPSTAPQPLPSPVRIPGAEVRGVVVGPDGKPVRGVEVALQVPGRFLAVGRGRFSDNLREIGLLVTTDAEGKFKIPLCEGVRSLGAASEVGMAHLSVAEVQSTGIVPLKKWGEIRGTFMLGNAAGTNRDLQVQMKVAPPVGPVRVASRDAVMSGRQDLDPLQLDYNASRANTDKEGHFIVRFVPPGDVVVQEVVRITPSSWNHRWVADLRVEAGQTLEVKVGATHRQVKGKSIFETGEKRVDLTNLHISLRSGLSASMLARLINSKDQAERAELNARPEFIKAFNESKAFLCKPQGDGSFDFEAVPPGEYELVVLSPTGSTVEGARTLVWAPSKPILVPEDAAHGVLDLGEVLLKPIEPKN